MAEMDSESYKTGEMDDPGSNSPRGPHVLVTGATGYVGGRLVKRLRRRGASVRCLVRDQGQLDARRWPGVEVVPGDLTDQEATRQALDGIDVAYYLVHSIPSGDSYPQLDRRTAETFAAAARQAGLKRIVYLGGLGNPAQHLGEHLASRQEVGHILAASGVPTIEFRAAIIVGSGSVSFEMIRSLTERLPVMITPRWVASRCQPIGVRNVLEYLIEALDHPDANGIYEIGGPDILTYRQMMLEYAHLRGLSRLILPFPVPHPEWSSRFIDIVTPIPFVIVRPLVASMDCDSVVRDDRARREFNVQPMGYRSALELALTRVASDDVETTWASSLSSFSADQTVARQLAVHEGMLLERHRRRCLASAEAVFDVVCALGGESGWPAGNVLWQLRGLIDRAFGGFGMRRGRRHPYQLRVGEPLDFWRVEALDPPHLLRLRAEMKLPGTAWLQFEILHDQHGSKIEQTAFFDPHGLSGYLYWHAFKPFHRFIFPGLIRAIAQRSEAQMPPPAATPPPRSTRSTDLALRLAELTRRARRPDGGEVSASPNARP
jgi:uncharacterized protein YbjT (DUF2867 family)